MKIRRWFMSVGGLVLATFFFSDCRADSASEKTAGTTSVRLIPCDATFASFSDCLETHTGLFPDVITLGPPINRLEYELRDGVRPLRLARLPADDRHLFANCSDKLFSSSAENRQRLLAGIGPGNYRLALLINGIRASNVIPIRIEPSYDYKSQPTLRLAKIEAPPFSSQGGLVAWVVGPPAGSPQISYGNVVGGALLCDGIFFVIPMQVFDFNPTFSPGERVAERLELERYEPAPPLSGPHTYALHTKNYPNASVDCDLSTTPLGDTWDRETATLTDAPASPPVLSGFVRDHSGHLLNQATVLIYNEKARYMERVDHDGHYTFTNLPPGSYTTDCYRFDLPKGKLHTYFPPIVIEPGRPASRDFTFSDDINP
jgi:hypothetical protein